MDNSWQQLMVEQESYIKAPTSRSRKKKEMSAEDLAVQKKVMFLRENTDLSHKSIAHRLGVTVYRVKTSIDTYVRDN